LKRVWLLALGVAACANQPDQALMRASRGLGQAVARGEADHVLKAVVPGARDRVDVESLLGSQARRKWAKTLSRPLEVQPEATLLLSPDYPVRTVMTPDGWKFAEDPTDVFRQDTPRNALRALVVASRAGRWDVLVALAPKRFRIGLDPNDLQRAWTSGEYAEVLTRARDRVAEHLTDPIVADAHEAALELGAGHTVRLEREGLRWVVVDFLPDE